MEWKGQSKSLRINGLLNSLQDEVSARVDVGEGGAVEDVDLEIGPGRVVEVSEYLSSRPRIDAADMTHPATAEGEGSREDVGQVDAIAIPGPARSNAAPPPPDCRTSQFAPTGDSEAALKSNLSLLAPPTKVSLPDWPTSVSLPAPPLMRSFPALPRRTFFTVLPVRMSLPEPPTAFSIRLPRAMIMLPVRPPTLEMLSVLRSSRWLDAKPEKSTVSVPPASKIVKAFVSARAARLA